MKKITLSCLFISMTLLASSQSQTNLSEKAKLGSVSVWDVTSSGWVIGTAYAIQPSNTTLKFYPTPEELRNGPTLVFSGTYTSYDGKVSGSAFDTNCNQIGNQSDQYFKPNAYLVFNNGSISFSNVSACNSIPVYKLVDDSVFVTFVSERTKRMNAWRFFVQKTWTKKYADSTTVSGKDFLIIDFKNEMPLMDACRYIYQMQRRTIYHDEVKDMDFEFTSSITASLLDVGSYRPFLMQGNSYYGSFPAKQSNVIIIK